MPFSSSRWASRGSANHTSVNPRIVGASETAPEEPLVILRFQGWVRDGSRLGLLVCEDEFQLSAVPVGRNRGRTRNRRAEPASRPRRSAALQGRSATGRNGQAAKEEGSALWRVSWIPENISGVPAGTSVFHLASPLIGLLARVAESLSGANFRLASQPETIAIASYKPT